MKFLLEFLDGRSSTMVSVLTFRTVSQLVDCSYLAYKQAGRTPPRIPLMRWPGFRAIGVRLFCRLSMNDPPTAVGGIPDEPAAGLL